MMNIYQLGEIDEEALPRVGGKARGLDFLIKNGFPVAEGFVATELNRVNAEEEDRLLSAFLRLGAENVAVRSSAAGEDGVFFSGAGQYETCLNVTEGNFVQAVRTCVNSLHSSRAASYSRKMSASENATMNIVVEKMVNSRYSGVAFSADPVAHDKILIEAAEGLGENLVGGMHSAYRYEISKEKFDLTESGTPLIGLELLCELYGKVKEIRALYGAETDLEWAVDQAGKLWFLQLRPVTVTERAEIGEFDSKNNLKDHLITTRNIGEMLPGAITPLTISTSVLAIDYGIRNMMKKIGVIRRAGDLPDYYAAFSVSGHLFIDMTAIHIIPKKVFMASVPAMNLSIMGEAIESDTPVEGKEACFFVKLANAGKFAKYLFSSEKAKKHLDKLCAELSFTEDGSAKEIYREISEKLPVMNEALSDHYVCSSFSGAMSSGLSMMFADKFSDKSEYQSFLSRLFSDIEGIESADILKSLRKIARLVLGENKNAAELGEEELYALIQNGSEALRASYQEFLARHGHRSVKEAELRSKAWKNDTPALMRYLKTVMRAPDLFEEETPHKEPDMEALFQNFKKSDKKTGVWLGRHARKAVVDREYSKSRIIRVIDVFKDGYARLAAALVEEGLLSDEDSVYFLTHRELGELIGGDLSLKKKALQRRSVFREQETLRFDDVCYSKPVPAEEKTVSAAVMKGVPVYAGKVSGRARIVRSLADADKLQKGEIMVAAFTDIGWSPYYSVIGGLVTEVGSALSHGAVVAREYALPTIVNVKNATHAIHDGALIMLDGERGEVSLLENN